jgi:hypothetical protein
VLPKQVVYQGHSPLVVQHPQKLADDVIVKPDGHHVDSSINALNMTKSNNFSRLGFRRSHCEESEVDDSSHRADIPVFCLATRRAGAVI